MATSPPQDSELAHSFGPQEIGFDYLPLELTPPQGFDVRTQPAERLPVYDLASDAPLALPALNASPPADANGSPVKKAASPGKVRERPLGTLWLDGDVLMCACPQCQAPMSVRLWLMVAA